jgi:NAD(P)-dependent dehydrogenase (short-subunit alcohol dehydrogenase family)
MSGDSLQDRVAIVTGGGGAIGGAMAHALAAAQVRVAVWDLRVDSAEERALQIRDEGGTACGVGCDVLDADQVASALERTVSSLGPVDILINGAGGSRKEATTGPDRSFDELLPADLLDTLSLNYLSAVLPCQAVAGTFAERGRGVVLNIASVAGIRPLTRAVAYSSGKAALINFTQWLAVHMAQEYSPAIRVNALAPGFVLTAQNRFLLVDETTGEPSERGRQILAAVPMSRYGQAQEMTGAMLWLVSDAASYVTGAVIPVDGGLSANSGV